MKVASSAFQHESAIPERHTGEGENLSPAIEWHGLPSGTKSVAVICQDLDARIPPHWDTTFVHWLIYNIPANVNSLPEALECAESLSGPVVAHQGMNSFGKIGYSGPLPPFEDDEHHYRFCVYALDTELNLPPGVLYRDLQEMMEGHILEVGKLDCTAKREEGRNCYQDIPRDAPSPELGL
jgi:Raf kinase inhibitor-like YbhB/YbcL family protein